MRINEGIGAYLNEGNYHKFVQPMLRYIVYDTEYPDDDMFINELHTRMSKNVFGKTVELIKEKMSLPSKRPFVEERCQAILDNKLDWEPF